MIVHDIKFSREPANSQWSFERRQYEAPQYIWTLTAAPLIPELNPMYGDTIHKELGVIRYIWFNDKWQWLATETNYDSAIGPRYTVSIGMPV